MAGSAFARGHPEHYSGGALGAALTLVFSCAAAHAEGGAATDSGPLHRLQHFEAC
jgi:hypothetical protein